jgi:V/A-type H+-transporting ATPase subunit I
MAIARVMRTTVIGYRPVMEEVLEAVQRAGVMSVEAQPFELESAAVGPEAPERLAVEEQLAEAVFVSDFLGRFHTSDTPLSTFIAEKIHVESQLFFDMRYSLRMHAVYRECVGISDRLAAAERERERLKALIVDLEPWLELRLEIERWQCTERTRLVTGTVPAATGPDLRSRLREQVSEVTVQELGPSGDRQAWVVIAMEDSFDEVRSMLAEADFEEVSFPGLENYPAEEAEDAREAIAELERESARLTERASQVAAEHYAEAVALVQSLESRRDAVLVRGDVGRTERSFVVSGWIPTAQTDALGAALASYGDAVDVSLREPTVDEDPPVLLDNRSWLKPFELLTDLYGRPSYWGIDPTPLLAPFFLLFFAICIGDVGYGAMLIGGAWLIKHKLDVTSGVKRFMDLLITGGAASMVVGVPLASYFALPAEALPAPLRALQVIDPVVDITTFLIIALVIGIIQVFFGVFVAAWTAFKRGDAESAVFDQLSIVFLFLMLAVTTLSGVTGNGGLVRASLVIGVVGAMVMQGRAVQAAIRAEGTASWDRMLGIAWSAVLLAGIATFAATGAIAAVWTMLGVSAAGLFVSRSVRRGVLGVLTGAYNVYGLTGFVGDILSYLRLPALGLSGMLVGLVFNILTELVWESATPLFAAGGLAYLGGAVVAVLAVTLFVVGHTFNVVINLLGAFVHPARLQFVEFFSKFYEAGGQPFSPFRFRSDGLVLEAGGSGKERGRVS